MNWLAVTPEQVDAINAALPVGTRVGPIRLSSGELVLGADLLTDCGEGQTYAAAAALLGTLPTVQGMPESAV